MSSRNRVIMLDIDGVVADFVSGALKALKSDLKHDDINQWSISKQIGITDEEFFFAQAKDDWFWMDLKPYPDVVQFVDTLRSMSQLYFCSIPTRHVNCASHKTRWLAKHFGDWIYERTFLVPHKHMLSSNGRILIDDNLKNCLEWEFYGGTSVVFPRPWNGGTVSNAEAQEFVIHRVKEIFSNGTA